MLKRLNQALSSAILFPFHYSQSSSPMALSKLKMQGKGLPVTAVKVQRESGAAAPVIPNFGARFEWVVNATHRQL